MIRNKRANFRCPACNDPSAEPIHPGCQKRQDWREKRAAIKAAAKAKEEAEKKKAEEAAKDSEEETPEGN